VQEEEQKLEACSICGSSRKEKKGGNNKRVLVEEKKPVPPSQQQTLLGLWKKKRTGCKMILTFLDWCHPTRGNDAWTWVVLSFWLMEFATVSLSMSNV